jgi:hypothetical protein
LWWTTDPEFHILQALYALTCENIKHYLPYSEKPLISSIVLSLSDRRGFSVSGVESYDLFTDRYYNVQLALELDDRKYEYLLLSGFCCLLKTFAARPTSVNNKTVFPSTPLPQNIVLCGMENYQCA